MTQLQQLTNRLNALDEQKGKYMTVSELKSAVFAMSQSFSHTVPLEEQLRLLSILPAGQPLSAAQLNQTEQHLQQLIASYALLKHQKNNETGENTELTCQQESVFKKVQQSIGDKPIYVNTAEAEVRAFCERMEDLAQQIITWFEGSGIEIFLSKNISPI